MFDLSIWEIAIVAIVAVLVVGPRELPRALATAGKWLRKFRSISHSLRSGLDDIIRETEMKEMEGKWAQQNKQIMDEHPNEMYPFISDGSEDDIDLNDDLDISDNVSASISDSADRTNIDNRPTSNSNNIKISKNDKISKAKTAKASKTKTAKTSKVKTHKANKTKTAKASKAKIITVEKAKGDL